MNQGKGIFIIRSKEDVEKHLQERAELGKKRKSHQPLMGRIIQRYKTCFRGRFIEINKTMYRVVESMYRIVESMYRIYNICTE